MTLHYACQCGNTIQCGDEPAGGQVECPECHRRHRIPYAAPTPGEQGAYFSSVDWGKPVDTESVDLWRVLPGIDEIDRTPDAFSTQQEDEFWRQVRRFLMVGMPAALLIILAVFFLVRPTRVQLKGPATLSKENRVVPADHGAAGEKADNPRILLSDAQPRHQGKNPDKQKPAQRGPDATGSHAGGKHAAALFNAEIHPERAGAVDGKRVVEPPGKKQRPAARYTVNLGSFHKRADADRFARDLSKRGIQAFVWSIRIPKKGRYFRVSTGRFPTMGTAEKYARTLQKSKNVKTFPVKLPNAS